MSDESSTGPAASATSTEAPRLLDSLRGATDSGLALIANRLELLGVELAEERVRVLALLAYGATAFVALSAGMVFLAIFVTVLFWDEHRLLALGVFAALFVGVGTLSLFTALGYARLKSPLFSASLAELRRDRDALTPKP